MSEFTVARTVGMSNRVPDAPLWVPFWDLDELTPEKAAGALLPVLEARRLGPAYIFRSRPNGPGVHAFTLDAMTKAQCRQVVAETPGSDPRHLLQLAWNRRLILRCHSKGDVPAPQHVGVLALEAPPAFPMSRAHAAYLIRRGVRPHPVDATRRGERRAVGAPRLLLEQYTTRNLKKPQEGMPPA